MGQRANYAIVDARGWELYASRWRALRVLDDLALGPAALDDFRDEEPAAHWYDDVWCEGAVLVDTVQHVLLFFTWHHEGVDDRARRLKDIARAWPGWELRWAYGGVEDLVAYLGFDRQMVRTEREQIAGLNEPLPDYPQDSTLVLTIRHEDGRLRGYSVPHEFCEAAWVGPELVRWAEKLTPVPGRGVMSPDDSGPECGLHLDLARKEVGLWVADVIKGTPEELAEHWPGWRFEFWEDRHQEQTRRCGGDFEMFPFSTA